MKNTSKFQNVVIATIVGWLVLFVFLPNLMIIVTSFLTRETMWKWRDGAFVANRSADRDIIVCSLVAQRAGKLTSFAVAGTYAGRL